MRYKKEEIYKKHLQIISGIKFTFREIDVIACILHNRGNKKIASLLSVDYRTVEAHIHNIMGKVGCNSRDSIIDIIKKSGRLQHIREYYDYLIIESLFNSKLKKIATLLNRNEIYCMLKASNIIGKEKVLLKNITKSLNLAKIHLPQENNTLEEILCTIFILSEAAREEYNKSNTQKSITLLFDQKIDISSFQDLDYIDFRNDSNYCLSIFKIVEKIIDKPEVTQIIEEFKTEYQVLQDSWEGGTSLIAIDSVKKTFLSIKSISLLLVLIVTVLAIIAYYSYYSSATLNQEQNMVKTETWNIPPYLEYYTDREKITKAIWDRFNEVSDKGKTAILVGLHGLGGVGKTTLAKNAIYNPQQQYIFKGWFSAETEDLLKNDYFQLGEKHHLFTRNMSEQQKIIMIKNWLEQQGKILLVYDNVPDMEMLEKYLPNKGHIIITSRNYKIPGEIDVDVMSEQETINLFENLLPHELKKIENYWNELKQLSEELGYLPLALSQAAAYIVQNRLTIPEYLALYRTEKNELLSDKTMPAMDNHRAAYITWDMSLEKIKQHPEGKNSMSLLDIIAYCYPENIPKKLLAQYLFGNTDGAEVLKLHTILGLFRKYSLIKVNKDTITVHRLVHSWIKTKHSQSTPPKILKNTISAINNIYPGKNKIIENKTVLEIDFIRLLIPQLETLLFQAQSLKMKEIEYSGLISILGNAYFALCNYDRSKQLLSNALDIKKAHYTKSGNNIEIANILDQLAIVYIYLGIYKDSIQLLENALDIKRAHYGNSWNIDIANTLHQLGRAYLYLGDYKRSKALTIEAYNIKEKHIGSDHIDMSYTLYQLGSIYVDMGDYDKAKGLLKKTLVIREQHFEEGHVTIAYTLHQLAKTYLYIGNYLLAKKLLEKAQAILEKRFGLNHVNEARTLHQLGKIHLSMNNYKESSIIFKRTLDIKKNYYGPNHISTVRTLHQLGKLYLNINNYGKSKELLEKTLEFYKEYFGLNNTNTAYILSSLGIFYLINHNVPKSIELFKTALNIYESFYGSRNLFTLTTLENIGFCYLFLGEYDKGKEYLDKTLGLITKLYGNDSIFTAKSIANLGNAERILNNNKESQKLLKQSFTILEKFHDYDKITIAKVMANVGLLYGNLKNYKKEKKYLKKALKFFQKYLPPEHSDIKKTIKLLRNTGNNQSDEVEIGYPIILLP